MPSSCFELPTFIQIKNLSSLINLPLQEQLAAEREAENLQFIDLLKQLNEQEVDAAVVALNETISPQIDCTQCGNCCKSLMVNVTSAEADRASAALAMSRESFDEQFLEKGSHELMIMNKMPCHFLADNKCTIYDHRFAGCREFPALHLPGFTQRLFSVFMHYGRCPIIFHVVEELKKETRFSFNP
jgi:uncharacterized protein